MSDVDALAAATATALCYDGVECQDMDLHSQRAATILAALHESGYSVERAGEVSRLTADLVAATDPASCQWCGHHQSWHMCSGLGCDCRRAALAQPAPDATSCAECGHLCDATFCGCVAACKAHQS